MCEAECIASHFFNTVKRENGFVERIIAGTLYNFHITNDKEDNE